MSDTMTPEERRLKRLQNRKRQAQFGMANNAFGAAAGLAGTKLALDVAREDLRAHDAAKKGVKYVPKVRQTVTQRALGRLKLSPRKALIATGAVAAGSQAINAAADIQSTSYFGREVRNMQTKEKRMEARLSKSYETLTDMVIVPDPQGIGHSLVEKGLPSALRRIDRTNRIPSTVGQKGWDYIGPRVAAHRRGKEAAKQTYKVRRADGGTMVGISNSGAMSLREGRWDRATARSRISVGKEDVSKARRRFDPEDERFRRLGIYEGAGYTGGLIATGAGARLGYQRAKPSMEAAIGRIPKGDPLTKLKYVKGKVKPAGAPAALIATGVGLAGVGEAARRRATSNRNARWS